MPTVFPFRSLSPFPLQKSLSLHVSSEAAEAHAHRLYQNCQETRDKKEIEQTNKQTHTQATGPTDEIGQKASVSWGLYYSGLSFMQQ